MTTLAFWYHAIRMSEIEGMSGFAKFHYAQTNPDERSIIDQFERARSETAETVGTMLENTNFATTPRAND